MKANARAAKSQYDLAIFEAWHVAVFGTRAYVGKLEGLDKYLSKDKPKKAQSNDEKLAALMMFQSRGASMNIKKMH